MVHGAVARRGSVLQADVLCSHVFATAAATGGPAWTRQVLCVSGAGLGAVGHGSRSVLAGPLGRGRQHVHPSAVQARRHCPIWEDSREQHACVFSRLTPCARHLPSRSPQVPQAAVLPELAGPPHGAHQRGPVQAQAQGRGLHPGARSRLLSCGQRSGGACGCIAGVLVPLPGRMPSTRVCHHHHDHHHHHHHHCNRRTRRFLTRTIPLVWQSVSAPSSWRSPT
jgi:hypothetical protein